MQFPELLSPLQKDLSLYACLLKCHVWAWLCMNAECKMLFPWCMMCSSPANFSRPKEKLARSFFDHSRARADHSFSLFCVSAWWSLWFHKSKHTGTTSMVYILEKALQLRNYPGGPALSSHWPIRNQQPNGNRLTRAGAGFVVVCDFLFCLSKTGSWLHQHQWGHFLNLNN